MFRRDEVTNRVRVIDVQPGEPAQITVAQQVARPDGKSRTISQTAPIVDPCLSERVLQEVCMGDEIDATIVTEWSKEGYTTYLIDFQIVKRMKPRRLQTDSVLTGN